MQSNSAVLGNQCINFATISVENRASDPITVADGRYVGRDGFVEPRDFAEVCERFPQHVRNWVARHLDRSTPKQDVEDWTHDLLIHLRYLPAISKYRAAGNEDIVQTFDPIKHHGANAARFFNYINLCLGNRFSSMRSTRLKNPICRPGNLSLTAVREHTDHDQADDGFCRALGAPAEKMSTPRKTTRREASGRGVLGVRETRRFKDCGLLPYAITSAAVGQVLPDG